MDERDSDQLQFRGQDATECRNFIAALMKLAFAQGKQRDDQWMADFAATCMADDALDWWSALEEEVQGSWKLLRQAMLSTYRPLFNGGSGEEAEKFIRAVREKAANGGKSKDNEWIVTYVESCLAGEALRWHACLDSDTQENWKKLQQALLLQYPRSGPDSPALNLVPTPPAASHPPAPRVARRGRIRISNSDSQLDSQRYCYLSKYLLLGAPRGTLADALELEWTLSSDGLHSLSVPGSQIPGYDLLGAKWRYGRGQDDVGNFLGICAVDSRTNSTPPSDLLGDLLINSWDVSAKNGRSDGLLTVTVKAGEETLYPRSSSALAWFSRMTELPNCAAEFIFEPV